jgi:hypothetical protein
LITGLHRTEKVLYAIWDWIAGSGAIFQGTAAATLAWIIARFVANNHEPFFAPIAAVVALNASPGERGSNAVRLLIGVFVGILVGDATIYTIGREYWSLSLAVFVAMAIAKALGGVRIVNAQAAASAILTVIVTTQPGSSRLADALIGAGVALVFSQFLFSPEPVRLLRRAESAALLEMSNVLELTAQALDRGDEELVRQAMNRLRDLRDGLTELARVRHASMATARHSLVWRRRVSLMVGETESAGHLDLLGGSCLMLTRLALSVNPSERRKLAPSVQEISSVLSDLAKSPGDRATRQNAADQSISAIRGLTSEAPLNSASAAAEIAVRAVATDIMIFAGIDPRNAFDVMLKETENDSSS